MEILEEHIVATLAFAAIGLVIFVLAFWVMNTVAPFSIRKEIEEDQNMALAILMASVIIGISLIIMAAIMG